MCALGRGGKGREGKGKGKKDVERLISQSSRISRTERDRDGEYLTLCKEYFTLPYTA